MDKQADTDTIALLRKVEEMRKELRTLETMLSHACNEYGKRRGMSLFREWHVNNQHEIETKQNQRLEEAADRDAWEKANA
jgi:hypothetical protein